MSACERVLAIHHPLFIFVCSFTARAVAPCGHASGSVFDARMHSTLGALMRGCGRDGLKQAGTEEVLRRAYRHAVVLADARTHRRVNAGDSKHLILARTRTHLHASGHGTAVEAPRVKDGFVGKSACRAADGTEQTSGHPSDATALSCALSVSPTKILRVRGYDTFSRSTNQNTVPNFGLFCRRPPDPWKRSLRCSTRRGKQRSADVEARGKGGSRREGKEGRGARERRDSARSFRRRDAQKRNPSPRA